MTETSLICILSKVFDNLFGFVNEPIEEAKIFKEEILKRVPNTKGVLINDVGWIVGASSGPSTLNVYHYGTLLVEQNK